tara:strand:- start:876 stop:1058 length:183 start_codon:yes stop_codon:yes gene_type:complete
MDKHYIELIGIFLLLIFAVTMFYQGTLIMRQSKGYSQKYIRRDLERMRRRVEEVLQDAEN